MHLLYEKLMHLNLHVTDYKFRLGEIRMNWILRLFTEPKKQFRRVGSMLLCYPMIYNNERKKRKGLRR